MKLLSIFALLFCYSAWAIDFDHYHTGEEINKILRDEAAQNNEIAKFQILGTSQMGREISYLILTSDNSKTKEAIYINGTHHGDEKVSTESVLALADYIIKNKNKPEIKELLSTFAIYLQPLVNPDGHFLNTREDSQHRDINRDYAYPLRDEAHSFKIKETQLVKSLTDKVKFKGALAYHAGATSVLWSWCYTDQAPTDVEFLTTTARDMAQALDTPYFMQSHEDYATTGEFIDYLYWKYGTIAITVELDDVKTPPLDKLGNILDRSVATAMTFMDSVKNHN